MSAPKPLVMRFLEEFTAVLQHSPEAVYSPPPFSPSSSSFSGPHSSFLSLLPPAPLSPCLRSETWGLRDTEKPASAWQALTAQGTQPDAVAPCGPAPVFAGGLCAGCHAEA